MGFFSKIILSFTILTAAFMTAAPAFADSYGLDKAAGQAGLKQGIAGGTSVESVVGSVVSVALSMIGIIFFLLILYAGFNWMIARGNTEAVEKSKSIIEGAVIGLIIVMAAYAITNFVFKSLDQGVTAQTVAAPVNGSGQACPLVTVMQSSPNGLFNVSGKSYVLPGPIESDIATCNGNSVGGSCGTTGQSCALHSDPAEHCDCK